MEVNSIRWKDGALDDLTTIAQWYSNDDRPQVAEKIVAEILHSIDLLMTNPCMGRVNILLSDDTMRYRSFVAHPYYKIIYYTDDTNHVVHIMAIWDCRRDIASMKDLLSR